MKSYKDFFKVISESDEHWLGTDDHSRNSLGEWHGNLKSIHKNNSLSVDENNSLEHYSNQGHYYINKSHRFPELHDIKVSNNDRHTIHLDSALNKHTTEQPIHVWRGVDPETIYKLNPKEGDMIHDKGYVSTSFNPGVAKSFAVPNIKDKEKHVFHIKVPKNSKALYLNNAAVGSDNEHEVLLPRNSMFHYDGKTEHVNSLGYKHVVHHVTHIPEGSE